MTPAQVSMLTEILDKLLSRLGKKKGEGKQIIMDSVKELVALQEKQVELDKKLDAILEHLGIELVKQDYVVREKNEKT